MPILTFKSRDQSPGPQVLSQLAGRVAAQLDQLPERVWVLWEAVPENNYSKPDWTQSTVPASPIIEVWHKDSYSRFRLAELMRRLPEWCADLLKCDAHHVFVRLVTLGPFEGFVRGEFLPCRTDNKSEEFFNIVPIGKVNNDVKEPVDEGWGTVRSTITLDKELYHREALNELSKFSHLEVVFVFHRISVFPDSLGQRRPRGRKDLPLCGVLSQRCKDRINRIGVSVCKLLSIDGYQITVEGLDAIDGSPILDVKPVMRAFLPREATSEPGWVGDIMKGYF